MTPAPELKSKRPQRVAASTERALAASLDGKCHLRLYVAGATTRSREALRSVYQLCESELKDNFELEVVDVYQLPEKAREDQIVATPTLVRQLPLPVRRFIGNISKIKGLSGKSDSVRGGKIAS
jgi:circadian clock protein KaiB